MDEKKQNPQTKAKNKYNAKNYDSLRIVVPKGKKQIIKEHADSKGLSINNFVNTAIDEKIQRDTKEEV